ncbi:nuclear transport factor 2 family protein [Aureivirga sp. CE67]|uniref:nuclear transport factor 2 family protein n=1 Tax=Aureivirga sp. CE67 TaxID=1788983 RepID=UPI0018C8F9FB|nr:nuclear transport factor 2 family protein [Aureivirga sp. CE67]
MKKIGIIAIASLFLFACEDSSKQELDNLKKEIKMKTELADRNKENAKDFFKALEEKNLDRVVNLFAENGVQENPYNSGIFPTGTEGHEGIRTYWEGPFQNFGNMEFPIEEIYVMEDPSRVFVKYEGRIALKNDAGWYKNDYYSLFHFDKDGKILKHVEIFNPIVAAKGFGLLDQIK